MNVRQSLARLPQSIVTLIAASPSVQPYVLRGESLERVVGSAERIDLWLSSAEPQTVRMLAVIVAKFAALPFEMEQLVKVAEQRRFTGAEARVAIALLRREGIVFAVRKAWGDQLFYVPTDIIPLWQRRLLPVSVIASPNGPDRPFVDTDNRYRLPLSLELLLGWQSVLDRPISLTAKGTLNRAAIARLVASMRITPQELEPISFAYPDSGQLPRQAAFAIDLGLCVGVLIRTADDIRINESGLREWLTLSVRQADARLHSLLVDRYASADPQLHLAASALVSLPAGEWLDTRLFEPNVQASKADAWLSVLACCGWVERGLAADNPVFRIVQEASFEETELHSEEERMTGNFIVQPDGEIIVTPDVGLAERWTLEQTTERKTADTIFIYRLTRDGCARAVDAGYAKQAFIDFLERGSGEQLPFQVRDALNDWYERLGKTKFEEVVLLRAESAEVAQRLMDDPEISAFKLELVGDRDFIVEAANRKAVETRLTKLGYPPVKAKRESLGEAAPAAETRESGWIYRPFTLGFYEADPSIPELEELFPGVLDIPSAWVREPRSYHSSTRETLIQRAIEWQASLLVRREGATRHFVPSALERDGSGWKAFGRWRAEDGEDEGAEPVRLGGEAFSEIMIKLPTWEEMQTH